MASKLNAKPGTEADLFAKYDVRDELGSGAFSLVKLAVNKATGDKFAVKIIEKKNVDGYGGGAEGERPARLFFSLQGWHAPSVAVRVAMLLPLTQARAPPVGRIRRTWPTKPTF